MKLTVGPKKRRSGFALPTIILISTVMLAILMASIGAAAGSRVALDAQYYNQLASLAAESGMARANECLHQSGYTPQWATKAENRDLRPNTDCTGATVLSNPYSLGSAGGSSSSKVRTTYSIEAPGGSGIGSALKVVGTTQLVRTTAPEQVWRTYEQVEYLRIEPPKMIACPEGFISVPGNPLFGTGDFCLAKYETKNVSGRAASRPEGLPHTNITQAEAATAASEACDGCHLVTEAEWLTVAHNVMNVASNWSGGSVGSGYMYNGHNDNSPSNSLAASDDDEDGYYGTGSTSGRQRRTLRLSNGEVVWDLAGNVYEWSAGQASTGKPGTSGWSWQEWNTVGSAGSLSPNPLPSHGTPAASGWDGSSGIGKLYSNSTHTALNAFRRGGFYASSNDAGATTLALGAEPNVPYDYVGFRMAYKPPITCPSGYIPVPGNGALGTSDFCVSKYEAKSFWGIFATSEASGAPWVNVSQTTAKTLASDVCNSCRLITEAEWLTIAHNIASVPSNWSGGSVGSGYIYRGHTDNNPTSALAASTNDNDGYYGTGNASGDQRRTLRLSNGEVIWDFAGNAWEWIDAQITGNQPGASGYNWRQWSSINNISFGPNPIPSSVTPAAGGWTNSHGIGALYSDSSDPELRAFRRGGGRGNGTVAGIFTLSLGSGPDATSSDIGFRITRDN